MAISSESSFGAFRPEDFSVSDAQRRETELELLGAIESITDQQFDEAVTTFFRRLEEKLSPKLLEGRTIWLGAVREDRNTIAFTFYIVLLKKTLSDVEADAVSKLETFFKKTVRTTAPKELDVDITFIPVTKIMKPEEVKLRVQRKIEHDGLRPISGYEPTLEK